MSPDPEAIRIFDPSQFVEDYDERYGNIGLEFQSGVAKLINRNFVTPKLKLHKQYCHELKGNLLPLVD